MTVYGAPLINIMPWTQWKASSTYTMVRYADSAALGTGYQWCQAGTVPSKHIEWDVALIAGTWRLTLIWLRDSASGILTPSLNGVDLATLDLYGSGTFNMVTQWSSIAVAANSVVELKFRTDSKNGASSNYNFVPQGISLLRTGA